MASPAHTLRSLICRRLILLVAVLAGWPQTSPAGNPSTLTVTGQPLLWDTTQPIHYQLDASGLGRLTPAQSLALVQIALRTWETVPDTGLQFVYDGIASPAERDSVVQSALGGLRKTAPLKIASVTSPTVRFLFDNDGSLLRDLTGNAGTPGVTILEVNGARTALQLAFVVINGQLLDGADAPLPDQLLSDLLAIATHEVGHVLGLDHTLVNAEIYDAVQRRDRPISDLRYLPTMFPRYLIGTGQFMTTLHPDDRATLQWLYSAANRPLVSGSVRSAADEPVTGVEVIARKTSSPLCQAVGQATGATCPYFSIAGCSDATAGRFDLPLLQAGDYTLEVDALAPHFGTALTLQQYGYYDVTLPNGAEFFHAPEHPATTPELVTVTTAPTERDIRLAADAGPTPQPTQMPIDLFTATAEFAAARDDDPDCPAASPIDVAAEIGAEELVTVDEQGVLTSVDPEASIPTPLPTDESNATANLAADSASSGGCALVR